MLSNSTPDSNALRSTFKDLYPLDAAARSSDGGHRRQSEHSHSLHPLLQHLVSSLLNCLNFVELLLFFLMCTELTNRMKG